MKKLALQKIVMLIFATLALGSGCIASDALARKDVGGMGAGSLNGKLGRTNRSFLYSDYGSSPKGFDCWKTQDIPTNGAWRLHQDLDGTCY